MNDDQLIQAFADQNKEIATDILKVFIDTRAKRIPFNVGMDAIQKCIDQLNGRKDLGLALIPLVSWCNAARDVLKREFCS
jgi:hypothetical protein